MFDVVISGGGPTGMMLACELRLQEIRVLVVERDAQPNPLVRSLGLHPRSLEILDQRDILDRFLALGRRYPGAGHGFAGIESAVPVVLDSTHDYILGIPQPLTDRLLEDRARELGAEIWRGRAVAGIEQDEDSVTVALADGEQLSCRWLVGCDGGRSLVRTLLAIGFPGQPAQTEWLLGEIRVTTPPDEVARIAEAVRRDHRGFGIGPINDGLHRAVVPAASVTEDRASAPTLEEFCAQLRSYAGTDFGAHSPRALTRFTDATRLAESYRVGRVFLAGDAAHVHPPLGGQGLNLGIQDSFNLGWKLAAAVNGGAAEGLLDTYHAERHPVAAEVLTLTRAQAELINPSAGPQAVRRLFEDLMHIEGVGALLAERISGIGVRYDFGSEDPLVGRRLRDIALPSGRLYEALRNGRGLLLDPEGWHSVAGWKDHVDHLVGFLDELTAPAVLLRPDGHVVWSGTDPDGLRSALTRWFGQPGEE